MQLFTDLEKSLFAVFYMFDKITNISLVCGVYFVRNITNQERGLKAMLILSTNPSGSHQQRHHIVCSHSLSVKRIISGGSLGLFTLKHASYLSQPAKQLAPVIIFKTGEFFFYILGAALCHKGKKLFLVN